MPKDKRPPEPWRSFLDAVDRSLPEPVELHCFGGFVVTHLYGVARTTSDVDFLSVVPNHWRARLAEIAGKGSSLHRKCGLYLDPVAVATPPEDYETRLIPLFAEEWVRLRLYALEAHDLALCKLERNFERDRTDIQQMAAAGHLLAGTLRSRYARELRPYLPRAEWHDGTLELWLESYFPAR
jgi:hypothetical protein